MPTADKVTAGKPKTTGAIFRAPLGTTLPADATTELTAAFKDLGFASDEGLTNTPGSESTDVYAWGGTPVLNTLSEKSDEWAITLLESLNPEVLKTVYGDANVTVDSSGKTITVRAGADQRPNAVYVFDLALKGGALKRVVIPNGALAEVGEIVYKDNEPVGYKITIKAMDDGSGATHHEYIMLPTT